MRALLAVFVSALAFGPAVAAQDQAPAPVERPGPGSGPGPELKAYDRVITRDARSHAGIFTIHQIGDRLFYEIPRAQLGKEFLWVSRIAKTTLGAGYGGQAAGSRVVRWERRNNRVFLRNVAFDVVADPSLPIARAVQAANNDTILMAFNVETNGKDEAPVIEVTRLFTTDIPEFSARTRLRSTGFDASRSFIERAVSFPENIEVEATQTFTSPSQMPPANGGPAPGSPAAQNALRQGSATIVMHYSMVKLPEKPMRPRLFDERVGYFTTTQMDYGQDEQRAPKRRYITRYRLEKKDPSAPISDPVKPIVYWVDAATPRKWVLWIKKGIEDWQAAFEEAGFSHAILAKEAPTAEQDPDWSPEDARYSVVRWLPSTIENASGPHISDPRTGEILDADIQFYHNVMNLQRDMYFLQVGPLDPRATKLPLPDDLMGRLLEYAVAHEVGHTLGFEHNMKASSTYPAEKIRDKAWLSKMGYTPSIMDYSRFNYVAQPEDQIPVEDLVPRVGPYDRWATMWGYKPIPDATTPDAEKQTLDAWARQQDEKPWLRFSTAQARGSDPGDLTEAVGDADAVRSTALGLKNLQRVSDMLLTATAQPGEPYDDLDELYGRLLGQWSTELNHVTALVGGFASQQKHWGQDGVRFTPVPRARQVEAVGFLNDHAFTTPAFAVKPDILRRIEADGVLARIRRAQQRVLTALLSSRRLLRLAEQEAIDGPSAYAPADFLADVRKGIWREVDSPAPRIDAYRRNLQRAYLDFIDGRLNGRQPDRDDGRGLLRGELRALDASVRRALVTTTDRETRAHLADARDQIARILDPKFLPAAVPSGIQPADAVTPSPTDVDGTDGEDDWRVNGILCWPDTSVRRSGG